MADMYVPPGGPPQGAGPSKEIYSRMGEENIFRMCEDFYRELEASPVRPLFPADMKEASAKVAAFLVGLTGGPALYHQRYGPPRMRARHLPFPIDEKARQIWIGCFKKVLEGAEAKYHFPREHMDGFIRFLEDFSAWMVNRA